MPERFIFRQVYFGDVSRFAADGEIRAKNHPTAQRCHQTSYQAIVDRRGTSEFGMPCGGVVNDYVPFYFSPITAFTYTISCGNVPLIDPKGCNLGQACEDDRVFLVARPARFASSGLTYCFSNYALNSQAPMPTIESNLARLDSHVHWNVFDDAPLAASIPEIGYGGVCKYFKNAATPPERQTRSQKRMAEFLVRHAVPIGIIECIIAKTTNVRDNLTEMIAGSGWNVPIYVKRGCYFQ
ncbi:DUF4433 domain-containing protein [Mesorhizobium sp. KR2-14]|uniref:DUF4433 domain-containing protein n=1 Tax=Mesorhizobium sp. KR2-14 TaxID=3156610 RepID=UPI0032B5205F